METRVFKKTGDAIFFISLRYYCCLYCFLLHGKHNFRLLYFLFPHHNDGFYFIGFSRINSDYDRKCRNLHMASSTKGGLKLSRSCFSIKNCFLAFDCLYKQFMEQNYEGLSEQYFALADFLDQHEAELLLAFSDNPTIPRVARQTAWSIAHEIPYYYGWIVDSSEAGRDSLMAENIEFLSEELYPDKKIVVWAHNAHIRHSSESQPRHPMGTWFVARYRPELYTVGLYAYVLTSGQDTLDIHIAGREDSMEGTLRRVGIPYLFVDMLGQSSSEGNSWMFETMPVRYLDYYEDVVPRDHYDAILNIDHVHPAN